MDKIVKAKKQELFSKRGIVVCGDGCRRFLSGAGGD
jgi:hypothetical protein